MNKPRLIDANKAKKAFDPNTWQGDMMISILDSIPTAYDIDKVVEQLEIEKKVELYSATGAEIYKSFISGKVAAYDKAIEIVKGGADNG